MINMKLLAVVIPPVFNNGCSTRKTLWEEKFTGEKIFTLGKFSAVNMQNCGSRKVRKHIEMKGSDNYFALDISLKFYSLDKMKIIFSESKDNLGRSGKGLIASMGLKAKGRANKYKKARYAIRNVIKKDLSNIIREFEKISYGSYEKKRPKHELTDSYFFLARHLAKCMMRADSLNSDNYPVRTKMTAKK